MINPDLSQEWKDMRFEILGDHLTGFFNVGGQDMRTRCANKNQETPMLGAPTAGTGRLQGDRLPKGSSHSDHEIVG
jgi:hypothetical protein